MRIVGRRISASTGLKYDCLCNRKLGDNPTTKKLQIPLSASLSCSSPSSAKYGVEPLGTGWSYTTQTCSGMIVESSLMGCRVFGAFFPHNNLVVVSNVALAHHLSSQMNWRIAVLFAASFVALAASYNSGNSYNSDDDGRFNVCLLLLLLCLLLLLLWFLHSSTHRSLFVPACLIYHCKSCNIYYYCTLCDQGWSSPVPQQLQSNSHINVQDTL